MGVLAGDRDRPPDVVLAVVAQVAPGQRHPAELGVEEAQQQVDDGRLAGAARTDERDPLSRFEPEADAVDGRTRLARVAGAYVLERNRERPPWSAGAGRGGSRDGGFELGELEDPPAGGAASRTAPGRPGRAASRPRTTPAPAGRAARSGRGRAGRRPDAAAATASTPPTVSPVTSSPSASPAPAASASRRPSATSAASAVADPVASRRRSHPKATSSGAPRVSSTSSAVSSPRAAAWRRPARAGPRGSTSAGTATPPDEQAGGEDQAGGGQDRGSHADGHGAGQHRDERRLEAAQVEVLQRIDVGDHPRQQVAGAGSSRAAPARAARCARRTWSARRPSDAQRQVMGGEALQVADDRPAEPEEPDRRRSSPQRQDGGSLGRPRDQVAGRRHQPDAEQHGQRAEQRRRRQAPAGRTRQAGERR